MRVFCNCDPVHARVGDKVKFVYHGIKRIGFVEVASCRHYLKRKRWLTIRLFRDHDDLKVRAFNHHKITEYMVEDNTP